jgi:hypothetical protein
VSALRARLAEEALTENASLAPSVEPTG